VNQLCAQGAAQHERKSAFTRANSLNLGYHGVRFYCTASYTSDDRRRFRSNNCKPQGEKTDDSYRHDHGRRCGRDHGRHAQSDPISQRQALMKSNGQNSGSLNRMVMGQDPFDAVKVNAAFVAWTENASKLPALWPSPPPEGAVSRALPKIWDNKADFESRIAGFAKSVADYKDKAKTLDELKVAYPEVTKNCNGCHENYRRPAPPQGQKK
jgi:cytochrome c556